ncbi:hypothetical protein MLD38_020308 [Melastoma candidum]|uniref:Uncharacterized protein n=1 Tax=Melastoma candidum TaxID=119954 RepID=A0ACB9QCN0_9MYRT|nr:hypothetical protein MLD38_020308 [Melastoma candidum]
MIYFQCGACLRIYLVFFRNNRLSSSYLKQTSSTARRRNCYKHRALMSRYQGLYAWMRCKISIAQTELYFRVDGSCSPSGYYTPKNELEALISVLNHLENTVLGKNSLCKDVLKNLESVIGRLLGEFGDKILENPLPAKLDYCTKEKELLEWGKNNGVQSALQIACFLDRGSKYKWSTKSLTKRYRRLQ